MAEVPVNFRSPECAYLLESLLGERNVGHHVHTCASPEEDLADVNPWVSVRPFGGRLHARDSLLHPVQNELVCVLAGLGSAPTAVEYWT